LELCSSGQVRPRIDCDEIICGECCTNHFYGRCPYQVVLFGRAWDPENVTEIRLSFETLNGGVPSEVGMLTQLTYLSLTHLSLTGVIPTELGMLTTLTYLSLRENSLTGTIPSELGLLTNLTGLYLHDNGLTGEIPSELGNIENIDKLYLHENRLSGNLPLEVCALYAATVDCNEGDVYCGFDDRNCGGCESESFGNCD